MKSYRKELWFEVPTRRAFINITPQVEACPAKEYGKLITDLVETNFYQNEDGSEFNEVGETTEEEDE